MIKVYLDWNVISQMKNGNHTELNDIIFDNPKFLIPYSTSHIGDIFSSFNETEKQKELIQLDLEYLSKLTKDHCISNNGKEIILDFTPPFDLFSQRVELKDTFKDISLDGLSEMFSQDESTKEIGEMYINSLKSISLGEEFIQALENPETAEQMDKLFPGLKENPTMEGFFQSFSKMNIALNENDDYKHLREIVQDGFGINRDKIFNLEEPYKLIEKEQKNKGFAIDGYIDNSKNAPEWFNKVSNEYILLDMFGYQEDNVNVKKGRKETFKNTTEDAFHASFASTCSFYILNDKKSYNKTKKVYEKLSINTIVLKPDEFVDYYNRYLNIEDVRLNLPIAYDVLKNQQFYQSEEEGGKLRTYYLPYYLFDFFNKILVYIPNDNSYISLLLSQNKSYNYITYAKQVIKLVDDITELFGTDIEKIGRVKEEEFINGKWNGRIWKQNNITYKLILNNGTFQFCIEE
ncbi:hypothetical protein OA93_00285 [Flavobacterium sp. KMS]|uniref:hypothetical protein n=1 Tax=Flavobacterium sp. KMS TaxID=1566023 RepID=UPI00057C3872|nr:hypothetical protein [Flavobacterium sp. KMS]KIC00091.1 hypothetical protein OA93_00285 [Flavobacterium sp. KMS]